MAMALAKPLICYLPLWKYSIFCRDNPAPEPQPTPQPHVPTPAIVTTTGRPIPVVTTGAQQPDDPTPSIYTTGVPLPTTTTTGAPQPTTTTTDAPIPTTTTNPYYCEPEQKDGVEWFYSSILGGTHYHISEDRDVDENYLAYCHSIGAHPARIYDIEENDFVNKSIIAKKKIEGLTFLGGYFETITDRWYWHAGENDDVSTFMPYTNWDLASNEPQKPDKRPYAAIEKDGYWRTMKDKFIGYFLCEVRCNKMLDFICDICEEDTRENSQCFFPAVDRTKYIACGPGSTDLISCSDNMVWDQDVKSCISLIL